MATKMAKFITTYYTITADDYKGTLFSMVLADYTNIENIDITDYKNLVREVQKIWNSKSSNIDALTISPLGDFEVTLDENTSHKFYLIIDQKQKRSKNIDIELRIGGKWDNTNILNWQESKDKEAQE